MICLRDYIGVDFCGITEIPPSGLYLNSLPGLSFKSLQGIADSEQQTFIGAWTDIQIRAERRFELDVRQAFLKKWRIKSLIDSRNLGWVVDRTKQFTFLTTSYYGFEVDLAGCCDDNQYMNSALFESYLQQLFVYSSEQVLVLITTVRVFEYDTKNMIFQKTQTSKFNADAWNKVEVNFNFIKDRTANDFPILNNSQKYIVTLSFDQEFDSFEMAPIDLNFCDCCGFRIRPMTIENFSGDNIIGNDITYTTNFSGISAIMNARCSWNRLVCSNKDVFATAYWYLLGIETLNEQLNSERFNRFTTIDNKKAEKRKLELEIQYAGGFERDILGNVVRTIEGALPQAIDGIDLNCDECLECEGSPLKLMETTL